MPKVSVIVPVYNVEKYVKKMLSSVLEQSFQDVEVVVVNDGSTDNSEKYVKEIADKDSRVRLISKENGGVASARNTGIDNAQGEYIVFYDPDDVIPTNAIKRMYNRARKTKADIVIGVMVEISLGESMIYMHSEKLARQKKISVFDKNFFGAWSVCSKMFSLEFIKNNNLYFENMSNAEDGVYTFKALNGKGCLTDEPIIVGCNCEAYNYLKRPFWETSSATQVISSSYMQGLICSHNRIAEEAAKLNQRYRGKGSYLEELYVRFIEGELINGYYRGIWRTTENLIPDIQNRINYYKEYISDVAWEKLISRHSDISLETGLMDKENIAKNPLISVALINLNLRKDEINNCIESLLYQAVPFYEILIPKEIEKNILPRYLEQENVRIIEGSEVRDFVKSARGKGIVFINEPVFVTKNTLRVMNSRLKNDVDCVSVLAKGYLNNKYYVMPTQNAIHGLLDVNRRRKVSSLDNFISNKLFKTSFLEENDIATIYQLFNTTCKVVTTRKGVVVNSSNNTDSTMRTRIVSSINTVGSYCVKKLKRIITKDDIETIKTYLAREGECK